MCVLVYVYVCACVYTHIQTLSPSACPFPIQPPASPKMISMLTSGACHFAKNMFFLSTHGPSKCPNYFWHHQESSWPIMTTLWPIPLSEYFKTFIPFNAQRKKEDAWSAPIHAVWPCLQLSSPSWALSLLSLFTDNSMWAVAKSYPVECSALGTFGHDTEASGLQFLQ